MTLPLRRRPALLLLALGWTLSSCCATRQLSFDTPEQALKSWQSQLCHDEIQAEYACLAHELKLAMGGFPTYVGARHRLLADHLFAAAYLKYGNLAEREHERLELGPDHVRFEYSESGQRFTLGFQREAWVVARFDDQRPDLQRRLLQPLRETLGVSGARQWLDLPSDFLNADQRAHLFSLQLEHRWKISSVDGLLDTSGAAEEPES